MSKYSVHQQPVETLLSWIKSSEIAIPEIQRPFVWKASKVRNLIDSLYKGYPVGYIITWRNPDLKTKDGKTSSGKKILIDGQQRITALTAAIVGQRVLNKNYKESTINIAFNPQTEKFDTLSKVMERSPQWINSISEIVDSKITVTRAIRDYLKVNPEANELVVEERIEKLKKIKHRQIGIIELDASLSIDTVTEIFIRINQSGVKLSNADFVMSKIASDEVNEGNIMRKLVDYFCRLIVDKDFLKHIINNDKTFTNHHFYKAIKWMASEYDDLYIPDYVDVLRVAFTYKFNRGQFSDLVALLSGRNFETRSFESEIAQESFAELSGGLLDTVNKTNYQRFIMLIKSAGFISNKFISSKNSLNFSYVLYLKLKEEGRKEPEIQYYVRRWFVMSLLLGRYSGSAESRIDEDIKNINEKGIEIYLRQMEQSNLGEGFWDFGLASDLESSSTSNNAYNVYLAAQCYLDCNAFLSKDMSIKNLMEQRGDVHHIFPKEYLIRHKYNQKQYNQVANYVYTEQQTNIIVGKKAPAEYFDLVKADVESQTKRLTNINSLSNLEENLTQNEIPSSVITSQAEDYEKFLEERRMLMARKIKRYYELL